MKRRGPGGPNKSRYKRDGWSGPVFRSIREGTGMFAGRTPRSIEWVAAQTGVTARSVQNYETNTIFPPHKWRDEAALALGVKRKLLGLEGD